MQFYYINFALLIVWYFCSRLSKNRKKAFCILATVQLALVLGLRDYHEFNVDLLRYNEHYYAVGRGTLLTAIAYSDDSALYYVLNFLFARAGISFQGFIFVLSLFQALMLGVFIYRLSENALVSYFIYFGMGLFTFSLYGLRQTMAMGMLLLCYLSFIDKKYKTMILLSVCAVLSHPTAIIIVPFLVLSRVRLSGLVVGVYTIAVLLVGVFRIQVGRFITTVFAEEYDGYYTVTGRIGGMAIACIAIVGIFFFLYRRELKKGAKKETMVANGLAMSAMIQLCSAFAYSFTRLNFYLLLMSTVLAVPMIVKKICFKGRYKNLLMFGVNSCVIIVMIYMFLNGVEKQGYEQYSLILN